VEHAKSVSDISTELALPARSVYRYTERLCELGLLATERNVMINTGGKYSLFRSMVQSVAFTYDVQTNNFEIDLTPNRNILDKFLRFWSYLGR
jgi:predicted transcriptional regulator